MPWYEVQSELLVTVLGVAAWRRSAATGNIPLGKWLCQFSLGTGGELGHETSDMFSLISLNIGYTTLVR